MVIPQGSSCPTLLTTTQATDANLSAEILWPKHPQTLPVLPATRSLCLLRFFSCCASSWKERTSRAMRKEKGKTKIYEWASILVTEYRPVHSEITTTKPVPKQRHLKLRRTGVKHGVAILKEISQGLNVLRSFNRRNKCMQNDGHHLPIMDQHRVFTNLLKILEIRIMSLVFLWRWGRDAHAYYLMHRVRDTMPGSTKLSDNGGTFLGSPMLGEAQFCVPNNNPY